MKTAAELARQVSFVLYMAEWVLGRRVRTVLDVGCGEGNWYPVLRALRPRMAYQGVDPSAYAVSKFGARRNLQQGGIEDLGSLDLREQYDLVVCCGMLNYLSAAQLTSGIGHVARRTGGMAYLELFTNGDHFEGDTDWPPPKSTSWYRRLMQRAGLVPVGMQCYVAEAEQYRVSSLERL
ncbi:methyltransferase [Gemmatimonas sp.]|uniref:methyltransferase n=1 Tax=Gemmatimonas sp. TaxID=1962908 RepID=UPI00398340A2